MLRRETAGRAADVKYFQIKYVDPSAVAIPCD